MKFTIKTFRVSEYIPGLGPGTYSVGKADIYKIEQVEQGIVVYRGRGGKDVAPVLLITWPMIRWAHIEVDSSSPSKGKKTA